MQKLGHALRVGLFIIVCVTAASLSLGALSLAVAADYSFSILPDAPGANAGNTLANGINDVDQIVGHFSCGLSCGIHGFRLSAGSFTIIDVPGAKFTAPYGTNKAGQIVGEFGTFDDVHHGFLRDTSGSFTTFDVPGSVSISQPRGINADGQIAGWYADAAGRGHGFLRSAGGFTTIDVPNTLNTFIQGINDSGQIVGYTCCTAGATHGFLLSGGSFTAIDVPGAFQTVANGITNGGQIVGTFFDAAFRVHGFVRDTSGSFKTLDPSGSLGTDARGINNAGQIVGSFGDGLASHSFLASPTADCTNQVTVNAFDAFPQVSGLNTIIVGDTLGLFTQAGNKGSLVRFIKAGTPARGANLGPSAGPGIVFQADVSIEEGSIPIPEIHIRYIQNLTGFKATFFYDPKPDRLGVLQNGVTLPLLDAFESSPPFYQAGFVETDPAGPARIVTATDSPSVTTAITLADGRRLQSVDSTNSFTMYLGCYDDQDPTFRTLAALDWSVLYKGSIHPRPPTFVEAAGAGITAQPARPDTTSPVQVGPLANGATTFVESVP